MTETCGVCEKPAVWIATVPIGEERDRYPICEACLDDLTYCDFAENVALLSADYDGVEG